MKSKRYQLNSFTVGVAILVGLCVLLIVEEVSPCTDKDGYDHPHSDHHRNDGQGQGSSAPAPATASSNHREGKQLGHDTNTNEHAKEQEPQRGGQGGNSQAPAGQAQSQSQAQPQFEEYDLSSDIDTDNDMLRKRRRQAKNDPYFSNSLEEILARFKARRTRINPKLRAAGAFKYLTASASDRNALTVGTGSSAEVSQHEKDTADIESVVYSNYEIYVLFTELSEFIFDALFSDVTEDEGTDGHGTGTDNDIYWTQQKKLKVIRALDEAFKDIPAWGRYWMYMFEKKLAFMEKYG